jgi:hypothetical protein
MKKWEETERKNEILRAMKINILWMSEILYIFTPLTEKDPRTKGKFSFYGFYSLLRFSYTFDNDDVVKETISWKFITQLCKS